MRLRLRLRLSQSLMTLGTTILLVSAVSTKAFILGKTATPQWRLVSLSTTTTATTTTIHSSSSSTTSADIEQNNATPRGKVNEIDFCIAPADASLSQSASSLTRYLNNASNRAVRRILLARSWPSAEALNLSLRQVLLTTNTSNNNNNNNNNNANINPNLTSVGGATTAKCPIPRPILNILMRRRDNNNNNNSAPPMAPLPRSRSDDEYVQDQLRMFRETHAAAPGFQMAESYLECILSLATSGIESNRVNEVLESKVYNESYRRVIAVLQSVGVQWEELDNGRRRIAPKLLDQDICLSVLDKINIQREKLIPAVTPGVADSQALTSDRGQEERDVEEDVPKAGTTDKMIRLKFWSNNDDTNLDESEEIEVSREDLGGVLLSSEEPSMTRQLNVLSNIVQRALLFGGDQELLVLSETLEADKPAFIQRWYPSDTTTTTTTTTVQLKPPEEEERAGVQFLNSLVQLLKNCYNHHDVGLDPPLPLIPSYMNSYERLTATLVELGSGYIKAEPKILPKPRTAQEELGRFAVWETKFRLSGGGRDISTYPEDMAGTWQVQDAVGGQTIGVSNVIFQPQGQVQVDPPFRGLRWRLDPGPTHLDTCTFQVLSDDGAVLQYRGFVDRGARLEARFSKRPIRIRGSVMFQMRDETQGYWKDMLPINYRTDTTKFVMTKQTRPE